MVGKLPLSLNLSYSYLLLFSLRCEWNIIFLGCILPERYTPFGPPKDWLCMVELIFQLYKNNCNRRNKLLLQLAINYIPRKCQHFNWRAGNWLIVGYSVRTYFHFHLDLLRVLKFYLDITRVFYEQFIMTSLSQRMIWKRGTLKNNGKIHRYSHSVAWT